MTFVEGPLVLMTAFLLVLLLPILLGVPIVYSIALSSILIMILPVGPSFSLEILSTRVVRSADSFHSPPILGRS